MCACLSTIVKQCALPSVKYAPAQAEVVMYDLVADLLIYGVLPNVFSVLGHRLPLDVACLMSEGFCAFECAAVLECDARTVCTSRYPMNAPDNLMSSLLMSVFVVARSYDQQCSNLPSEFECQKSEVDERGTEVGSGV